MVRENAAAWQDVLARSDGLTTRPSDDRWSALEYACHARDVFRLYDERLEMMLTEGRFRRSYAGLRLPVRVTW